MSNVVVATILATVSGPVAGGLIITGLSWRWIFIVNIPVGIVSFTFGARKLTEHREPHAGRFDVAGFMLAGGGFALLVFALSQGPVYGWAAPRIFLSGSCGLGALLAFVRLEMARDHPLLRLRLLTNRSFRRSTTVVVFATGTIQGILFVAPLYLQEGRGFSPIVSSLTTLPEAIGVIGAAQIVRRVYPRLGPRRLMVSGLSLMTAILVAFALIGPATNLWLIRGFMLGLGFGMAQTNVPVQIAAFATIDSADTGHATAIFNSIRRASPALSVAILSTVLLVASGHRQFPRASDFRPVFLACAVFTLLGALFALRIVDRDAASTMHPRRTSTTVRVEAASR